MLLDRMEAMEGRLRQFGSVVGDIQERRGAPGASPEDGDDDAGRDSDGEVAFTGAKQTPPAVPPAGAPAPASQPLSAIKKMDTA